MGIAVVSSKIEIAAILIKPSLHATRRNVSHKVIDVLIFMAVISTAEMDQLMTDCI